MTIGKAISIVGKAIAILVGVALLVFVLMLLNQMFHPFAITDPDNPRFDAKHFRFENYSETNNHFRKSIEKMFPPGTDRAYVEQIFVKQGGAEGGKHQNHKSLPPEYTTYSYQWPPKGLGGWVVAFIFDENNKSVMMSMGKPIYGTHPAYEEIQERKRKRRERMGHGQ